MSYRARRSKGGHALICAAIFLAAVLTENGEPRPAPAEETPPCPMAEAITPEVGPMPLPTEELLFIGPNPVSTESTVEACAN